MGFLVGCTICSIFTPSFGLASIPYMFLHTIKSFSNWKNLPSTAHFSTDILLVLRKVLLRALTAFWASLSVQYPIKLKLRNTPSLVYFSWISVIVPCSLNSWRSLSSVIYNLKVLNRWILLENVLTVLGRFFTIKRDILRLHNTEN